MLRQAENELRVGIGDYTATVAFKLSNATYGAAADRWKRPAMSLTISLSE
jgi:hypothetical protein